MRGVAGIAAAVDSDLARRLSFHRDAAELSRARIRAASAVIVPVKA